MHNLSHRSFKHADKSAEMSVNKDYGTLGCFGEQSGHGHMSIDVQQVAA